MTACHLDSRSQLHKSIFCNFFKPWACIAKKLFGLLVSSLSVTCKLSPSALCGCPVSHKNSLPAKNVFSAITHSDSHDILVLLHSRAYATARAGKPVGHEIQRNKQNQRKRHLLKFEFFFIRRAQKPLFRKAAAPLPLGAAAFGICGHIQLQRVRVVGNRAVELAQRVVAEGGNTT